MCKNNDLKIIKKMIEEKCEDENFIKTKILNINKDNKLYHFCKSDGNNNFLFNDVLSDTNNCKAGSSFNEDMEKVMHCYLQNNLQFFLKDCNEEIPKDRGVYIFFVKEEKNISIKELFQSFVVVSLNENNKLSFNIMSTPKINLYKNELELYKTIHFNIGEIIYVGKDDKLYERYEAHKSNQLNGTGSMKFGLRKSLCEIAGYCAIEVNNVLVEKCCNENPSNKYAEEFSTYDNAKIQKFNEDLELYIRHKYGSRFGI